MLQRQEVESAVGAGSKDCVGVQQRGLRLSQELERKPGAIRAESDGSVRSFERAPQHSLHSRAEITLALPAGTWAAILAGDKKIEPAFLQGKLQVEGKPETALPLRRAFGL